MQSFDGILLLQHVYSVAEQKLFLIGSHPNHVEQGHVGYFMTLESLKEIVKSFDPQDWYKEDPYEGKAVSLDDLPVEDRWKLEETINDLTIRSMSPNHLVKKCDKCLGLSLEFGDKILKLNLEKGGYKKAG
jgi:hypothetical protein